jgi:ribose transport system ATP-binding protein
LELADSRSRKHPRLWLRLVWPGLSLRSPGHTSMRYFDKTQPLLYGGPPDVATSVPLLEVRSVSKQFPGVQALDHVSLRLERGEVLAVVGENGAGKSTLMKVLAGIYRPDAGSILLEGLPVPPGDVPEALRLGISLIHQELNLANNLSVAGNLFLGRELLWGGMLLRNGQMNRAAIALMERVGLVCTPETPVGQLSPGQRQLVEIARALAMRVRILIMDEPTSSLTQAETDRLYDVVFDLKQHGVAVVYISHRLAEVQRIADRVVVLRDGRNAGELFRSPEKWDRPATDAITYAGMVRLMVGREPSQFFQKQSTARPRSAAPRLEVRELCYAGGPGRDVGTSPPVSFALYGGEIVGVAGLMGAGRTELAEALFGIRRVVSGQILLDGEPLDLRRPRQAIEAGLVLVPEDRRQHGLMLSNSIQRNIGLPNLGRLSFLRLVSRPREHLLAEEMASRLRVSAPGVDQLAGLLSGGNQQKVVLGKWLARRPKVLIFDEPTRGIDVGAKSEIYTLMDQLAGEGVAILMISSDLEEILGMSDRVLVMHQGRIAGELARGELSEEAVMHLATGGRAGPH